MIDPTDPVLLLLVLSLALGIMLFISQLTNSLLFQFLDKELPNWRHKLKEFKNQDRSDFEDSSDCYSCQDCGSKVKSEILGDGLLFYCPECSPIQYCEKRGRPYKDKCDCAQCVH